MHESDTKKQRKHLNANANKQRFSVAGLCYLIDAGVEHSTPRIAAVATFTYLFAAFYSPGKPSPSSPRSAFPSLRITLHTMERERD